MPRLTEAERNAIVPPVAEALQIFNTTSKCFETFVDGAWQQMWCHCVASTDPSSVSGNTDICLGGSTTLSVQGGSLGTGASWKWFTGSCGGTAAGTGSAFSTTPSGTTTYYVRAEGTCGTTDCAVTTVNVDPGGAAPVAIAATDVNENDFDANWNSVNGALAYYLDVSTDAGFNSFVSGYNNLNVGTVTTYPVSGLTGGITYYYRVRSGNSCGAGTNSTTISVQTDSPPVTMTWTDGQTGSCTGQMYATMQTIANAMPSGPLNVKIKAQQISPSPNYGLWEATFPSTTCVKQWLQVWGNQDVNTYNNWNPAVCQATDSGGTSYYFVLKNDGGGDMQVAIYPVGASAAEYMKIYVLDRTGAWCDLAGVNNRPGYDSQVTNSNTSGVSGDYISFTWW